MPQLREGWRTHWRGTALLGTAILGVWWVFPGLGFAVVLALVAGALAVWWRGSSDALQGMLVGLIAGLLAMEAGFVSFVAKEASAAALGLSPSPASFGYSWPQTLVAGLSMAANLGRVGMLWGAVGGVLSAILASGSRRIASRTGPMAR